jgi:hypothetical protein
VRLSQEDVQSAIISHDRVIYYSVDKPFQGFPACQHGPPSISPPLLEESSVGWKASALRQDKIKIKSSLLAFMTHALSVWEEG